MKIRRTKTFKKQYKACQKRGYPMAALDAAIIAIVENDTIALKAQSDHDLKGRFKGDRELHVGGAGDWLLRYQIENNRVTLLLLATGTHRDVLGIE